MKFLIFITFYLVTFSAHKCSGQIDRFDRGSLIGITWFHSHEEDQKDLRFYRPESYAFTPSRGRTGFQLLSDGSAIYKGIAPNDVPVDRIGKWELSNDNTKLSISIGDKGKPTSDQHFEYLIVSCQEDLLQLQSVDLGANQAK